MASMAAAAPDGVTSGAGIKEGQGLATGEGCACARCGYGGCDLRIVPCGCTVHARCIPLIMLADHAALLPHRVANRTMSIPMKGCSLCGMNPISGLHLFALSFRELEESGRSRCATATTGVPSVGSNHPQVHAGDVRKRGHGFDETADDLPKKHAAAQPFLGLSHSTARERSAERDRHHTRTGRWTTEEIAYVDQLIRYFEEGLLPIPKGVKLNEFLSDMLMCRSSRLTKKMKSAKLSTRSYAFSDWRSGAGFCCAALSRLEELFLNSVQTEPTRLELKFNLTRMWRTHFSNLCLQLGYDSLHTEDWFSSLGEMEQRASAAEEIVRKVQRKRMGLALRRDSENECLNGVFFGGVNAKDAMETHSMGLMETGAAPKSDTSLSLSGGLNRSNSMTLFVSRSRSNSITAPTFPFLAASERVQEVVSKPNTAGAKYNTMDEVDFLAELFSAEQPKLQSDDISSFLRQRLMTEDRIERSKVNISAGADGERSGERSRLESDDFSSALRQRFLSEDFSVGMDIDADVPDKKAVSKADADAFVGGGPFVSRIIKYMEETNVPFHHVDVWVPSYLPSDSYDGTDTCDGSKSQDEGHSQELRLCHAGHASRTDLNSPTLANNLNEFGVYSANFSFAPGSGLPGRIYQTGIPTWENAVQHATPKHFKRCGGAKLYGIKTMVGIPVNSPKIGRTVVALYSTLDVARDVDLVRKLFLEFQNYQPEPTWKLVVDVGTPESNETATTGLIGVSADLDTRSSSVVVTGTDHAPAVAKIGAYAKRPSSTSTTTYHSADLVSHTHARHENDSMASSSIGKSFGSIESADDEEQIASLLGEHMPSGSSTTGNVFTSSCIALRLLLLREPDRRSSEENEMIGTVKKSYRDYSRVNKRSREEIAALLAKDWSFLSSSLKAQKSSLTGCTNDNPAESKSESPSLVIGYTESSSSPQSRSAITESMNHVDYSYESSARKIAPMKSILMPSGAPNQASIAESSQRASPVANDMCPSNCSLQRQTTSLSKLSMLSDEDGSRRAVVSDSNSAVSPRRQAISSVSDPPTPKPFSSVVSM